MFNRNLLTAATLAFAATASFAQETFHEDERDEARRSVQREKSNGCVD